MVKPVQRTSFNISARWVFDKPYLLNTLIALNPTTVGVMDSLDLAKEIKTILPQAVVWHRAYIDKDGEKHQWKNDSEITRMLDQHERDNGHGIVLHVMNEPDRTNRLALLEWQRKFMQQARARGITLVLENSGTDERLFIESGTYDDFYRDAVLYGHYIGRHQYPPFIVFAIDSAGRLLEHILDPNKVQHNAPGFGWWPFPDDVQDKQLQGNFSMGRIWWEVARTRHLGLNAKFIITETGVDRKPNAEKPFRDGKNLYQLVEQINQQKFGRMFYPPHTTLKGQNTWRDYVQVLYDGKDGRNLWSFDQLMLENYKWMDWVHPHEVIGWNIFTWADSEGDEFLDKEKKRRNPRFNQWNHYYGHNVSKDVAQHNMFIAWSRQLESTLPPVEPPPPPPPDPDPEPPPDTPPVDTSASLQALSTALGAVEVAKAALSGAHDVLQEQIDKLKAR